MVKKASVELAVRSLGSDSQPCGLWRKRKRFVMAEPVGVKRR